MNESTLIYVDNASTTQPFQSVISAVSNSLSITYGNPSSTHKIGRNAKAAIETARKNIAKGLGALASEIIFTSGGTEANNLIISSCLRDLGVEMIITSPIEHQSVLQPIKQFAKSYNADIQYVSLKNNGDIDLVHLENLLQEFATKKKLVSLMHINNEIGNMLPLEKVSELCRQYNAYFHSDMVQSVGHYPIDFQAVRIDFATASAHKFHGLKGAGFAYIRHGNFLKNHIFGGEQERGIRAGTENLHGIIAMDTAFSEIRNYLKINQLHLKELKKYFIEKLREKMPSVIFNGNSSDLENSADTIVNVRFPSLKEKNDTLLLLLDFQGVACSKGSACQSGSQQKSYVLASFLDEEALNMPSLRFSFSVFTTKVEIDKLIEILTKI